MTTRKNLAEEHEVPQVSSRRRLFAVLAILLIAVSSIIAYVYFAPQPPPARFSLKAVIIDQLVLNYPNPDFVQQASGNLSATGFNVEYCREGLDVEFFRNLTKGSYGIIILRTHSAMRNDGSSVDFFTAEPFDTTKHVSDIDNGLVVKGVLTYAAEPKEYFAITPAFVENFDGVFPKSIIVAMGCHSLNMTAMADAFLNKGAQAYIGWDSWVGSSTTDAQTLNLLYSFLVSNETLKNAVRFTDYDLFYGSRMSLYPESADDIRISDLIQDATSQSR